MDHQDSVTKPNRDIHYHKGTLTLFPRRAYSFGVQIFKQLTPMHYYYYWCACTSASPQGGAARRNLSGQNLVT